MPFMKPTTIDDEIVPLHFEVYKSNFEGHKSNYSTDTLHSRSKRISGRHMLPSGKC
jgi:hypothetical protein